MRVRGGNCVRHGAPPPGHLAPPLSRGGGFLLVNASEGTFYWSTHPRRRSIGHHIRGRLITTANGHPLGEGAGQSAHARIDEFCHRNYFVDPGSDQGSEPLHYILDGIFLTRPSEAKPSLCIVLPLPEIHRHPLMLCLQNKNKKTRNHSHIRTNNKKRTSSYSSGVRS